MREILTLQDPRLLQWAGDRLQARFTPDEARTIAAVEGERLLCVVVYERFTPHSCMMHIASASPRWCTRRFLRAAFSYPFERLQLERVTFTTDVRNQRVNDLVRRLGARVDGVLRREHGDADGLLWGMTREECPWIETTDTEVTHGEEISTGSGSAARA